MKTYFLILFVAFSITSNAKEDSLSLEQYINTYAEVKYDKPQFVKAKIINLLSTKYVEQSPYFSSKCYSILGEVYRITSQPDSAKFYLTNALDIRMEHGYYLHAATSHEYLSRLLLSLGEDSLGMQHLYKSLAIKRAEGNPEYLKGLYSNIGNTHYNLEAFDSARYYHTLALSIYVEEADSIGAASAYNNLANIAYYRDYLDEAIALYKKSYSQYQSMEAIGQSISPLLNIGVCYWEKEKIDSALFYYNEALRLSVASGNREYLDYIYLNLAETYTALNQPNSAVGMFQNYIEYRDSTFSIDKAALILEYEAEYQTKEAQQKEAFERSEKEKAQIENENSRLTIYLLLSALGIIAVIIVFWWRNIKQKSKLSALEVDIKNQEIDTLLKTQEAKSYAALLEGQNAERERIAQDLHDQLGGTLSAVKVHFGLMDQKIEELKSENRDLFDKVEGMLSEAVQDVRRISHDLASGRIAKLGLKGALEDLAEILNTAKKLEVDFFMDDSLPEFDKKKEQEIYAIIQEIISNTLKHANAQVVELQLNRNDDMLNILYEDNGIGFDMELANQKGLGLTGINNRVANLNGNVNYDAVIGRGTIIIINIPL